MPKYSIIIPVFNAEKYLDTCLKSIFNQNYKQYEIVLIDDCSKDESPKICRNYAQQHPEIIFLQMPHNNGVSAARNLGVHHASGDYLLFIDSDDFIGENYFEMIEKQVGKYDLLQFGHFEYLVDETDNLIESRSSNLNYSISSSNLRPYEWETIMLKTFFASPCNKVFKRKIIIDNKVSFDEKCVCYEDYLFNLEYCHHVRSFCMIDVPLYFYREKYNNNKRTAILKRKWDKFGLIADKVSCSTEEFACLLGRGGENIRLYAYQAYLVELQAVFLRQPDHLRECINHLLKKQEFHNIIKGLRYCGKFIFILQILLYFRFYHLAAKLIMYKVSRI